MQSFIFINLDYNLYKTSNLANQQNIFYNVQTTNLIKLDFKNVLQYLLLKLILVDMCII